MRLGIDASNLRDGELTHLTELLRAAQPHQHGITKVVVWAGRHTLECLPERPWLELSHERLLDQPLPLRLYWQRIKLPWLAARACDCLFAPGDSSSINFRPFITMSRNALPFEAAERERYGLSWTRLKLHLLQVGQRHNLRRADGVIFQTDYAKRVVRKATGLIGWQPIIPHGINEKFFLPPRAQKPLSEYSYLRPFRFLYISNVEPYKHQWQVVEAVAQLWQEGLPVALDLIGEFGDLSATRRLCNAIARFDPEAEFVRYLGHIPDRELINHYQRADAFIFASSCETLPNILLEAMAAGLPIACSDCNPMPEALGEAGSYFNPERPKEIATALCKLVLDPALRARYSRAAYGQARFYSWERCARETFAYLAEVTERVRSREPDVYGLAATEAA
jgi:glycosyltransferase involved in cell wall biosynthesis